MAWGGVCINVAKCWGRVVSILIHNEAAKVLSTVIKAPFLPHVFSLMHPALVHVRIPHRKSNKKGKAYFQA